MRLLAYIRYTTIFIMALVFSNIQSATEPLNNLEVGRHYLTSLYRFDFSALEASLHPDAVFEDPTAVVAFPREAWRFNGREAILKFFRQSSNGIVDAGYQVRSEFKTGEFVVFYLEYWSKVEGKMLGVPGQIVSVKMPGVRILRIRNGLVIHHTDHMNYHLMLKQVAKQSKR